MFAYEVMSRRPISTNMLARTGSRRRSEMRAATWLPTEIPSREPSSRAPTMDQSTLPMSQWDRTQMVSTVAGTDPRRQNRRADRASVRGPHPRRPLEPSIHVLEQELLEPLTKRDQRGVRCCLRANLTARPVIQAQVTVIATRL